MHMVDKNPAPTGLSPAIPMSEYIVKDSEMDPMGYRVSSMQERALLERNFPSYLILWDLCLLSPLRYFATPLSCTKLIRSANRQAN